MSTSDVTKSKTKPDCLVLPVGMAAQVSVPVSELRALQVEMFKDGMDRRNMLLDACISYVVNNAPRAK